MNVVKQKRQSCEACRRRKLKCSGEKTGCSRCLALSLTCKFQDKGAPGRPRKRPTQDLREAQPQRREQQSLPECDLSDATPSLVLSGCSQLSPSLPQGSTASPEDHVLRGYTDFCQFPMDVDITGNTNADFCSFPPDLLACHPPQPHDKDFGTQSLDASVSSTLVSPSCDCADGVTESIRTLRRSPLSHSMVRSLRVGADLAETLLTCPICYDVSQPPRITIQNVMLIGRLAYEITAGYHRYLKWLKESSTDLTESAQSETIYLIPGLEISPILGFKIDGEKFQEIIRHGLQKDAERLEALGKKFAQRQHDRHNIGHEACPDSEGNCWKEEFGGDLDPSDMCPCSPAAKSLTPCFRIVDEVRAAIKGVGDAVAADAVASDT